MHIVVGSTNPVKINAVRIAAAETWPDVIVEGIEVESGVDAQPRSDDETRLGAEQRARKALQEFLSKNNTKEVVGVGLEGGVFEYENGELWNTVWVSVIDKEGYQVSANGERFKLPEVLAREIRKGKEMGPAMDSIAGTINIKHGQGMIGYITQGFIDRTEMYAGLTKLTLGLWYGRHWTTR